MARRKKSNKPKRRTMRRRSTSMGAVAGDMLMTVGGLAAGAIAAKQLNKVLKFDARILAAGKVALGVALPKFVKNPFMASVGNGMVAVGATELVGSFIPALAGADDVVLLSGLDEIGELDEMSGMDEIGAMDISEVNGTDINEVNGFDEIGEIEMI
jgi:hypothetical protein